MLSLNLKASRQTIALILTFAGGGAVGGFATAAFGQTHDRGRAPEAAQCAPEQRAPEQRAPQTAPRPPDVARRTPTTPDKPRPDACR